MSVSLREAAPLPTPPAFPSESSLTPAPKFFDAVRAFRLQEGFGFDFTAGEKVSRVEFRGYEFHHNETSKRLHWAARVVSPVVVMNEGRWMTPAEIWEQVIL